METIEVYTEQALHQQLKYRSKLNKWYILKFRGYSFKIYNLWPQIMQSPAGIRDSGLMDGKTQKSLISQVQKFIDNNK